LCAVFIWGFPWNHACSRVGPSSLHWPMIKMLWYYVVPLMGVVSLVICARTNVANPTWLTWTIRVASVSTYLRGFICVCVFILSINFLYWRILFILCIEMSSYAMYKGRIPWVYDNWENCWIHVHHFSGCIYKWYNTMA
jgi:hypothetical protein